jgi:hypothetical protein
MSTSLHSFIRQFTGVVIATLVPVVLVAFLTIPFTLGGHPGEMRPSDALVGQHLT